MNQLVPHTVPAGNVIKFGMAHKRYTVAADCGENWTRERLCSSCGYFRGDGHPASHAQYDWCSGHGAEVVR